MALLQAAQDDEDSDPDSGPGVTPGSHPAGTFTNGQIPFALTSLI